MSILVYSTLPHYALCLLLAYSPDTFPYKDAYTWMIAFSSTLSVIWHAYNEPRGILFWLDYGLAGIWLLMDVYIAYLLQVLDRVLLANLCVTIVNLCISRYSEDYAVDHSAWHLLHIAKGYYVIRLFLF